MAIGWFEMGWIEDLESLPDPHERLNWLMARARAGRGLAVGERVPANRVPGCVSPVWLVVERGPGGRRSFRGDAESAVLRAFVSALAEWHEGRTDVESAAEPASFLERLGLVAHLTPTRREALRRLRAAFGERASG